MNVDSGRVITVSELNDCVKAVIDSSKILSGIYMRGEISNCKIYSSGHMYFSLKDEESTVRAVMFRAYVSKLKFRPCDGMKVIVYGRVDVYSPRGEYQFNASAMQPDGIGELAMAFEQLRQKLQSEGLFDESRKKKLPAYPERIGVITSPSGAAVHDIINITGRRYPSAEIILYPSAVQGEEAEEQLLRGLAYFNFRKNVDVIIIGRGGGSAEDLWVFNSELLARNIAASKIPVISAVGHESDFTICDFAADKRAPTPSAAAELSVPDSEKLLAEIYNAGERIFAAMDGIIENNKTKLSGYAGSRALTKPEYLTGYKREKLENSQKALIGAMKAVISGCGSDLGTVSAKLGALDPLTVLDRGYAFVTDIDGKAIESVKELKKDSKLKIKMADGEVKASVEEIKIGKVGKRGVGGAERKQQ